MTRGLVASPDFSFWGRACGLICRSFVLRPPKMYAHVSFHKSPFFPFISFISFAWLICLSVSLRGTGRRSFRGAIMCVNSLPLESESAEGLAFVTDM